MNILSMAWPRWVSMSSLRIMQGWCPCLLLEKKTFAAKKEVRHWTSSWSDLSHTDAV